MPGGTCSALPRAVFFDLDGVILESAQIKTRAFLELFAAFPEHREAIRRHHLRHVGESRYSKFDWIYRELLRRPLPERESRRLGREYSRLVLRETLACPLVAGAERALAALRGRALLFVVSGTPQEELETILAGRGLRPCFEEVRGSPARKEEILDDLLRRFDLRPADAVLVGDGLSDHRAAAAAGIRFILRRTPEQEALFRDLEVERVDDLDQLLHILDRPRAAAR